ncbi:MAG: hypothetical protein OEV42_17215 [Deltaproteobacteria bacterium]|nr:hypothetical protein [Deltaproteobacteria bacterium]
MNKHLKNQSGFALISSLFVIIFLTLIGTVAMTTTNHENKISEKYRCKQEVFYTADGAAQIGINHLKSVYHVSHRPKAPLTDSGKSYSGSIDYSYVVEPPPNSVNTGSQKKVGFSAKQETRYKSTSRMYEYGYISSAVATNSRCGTKRIELAASYLSDT